VVSFEYVIVAACINRRSVFGFVLVGLSNALTTAITTIGTALTTAVGAGLTPEVGPWDVSMPAILKPSHCPGPTNKYLA